MLFVITFPCLFPARSSATASTPASERPAATLHTRLLGLFISQKYKHSKRERFPGMSRWVKMYPEGWSSKFRGGVVVIGEIGGSYRVFVCGVNPLWQPRESYVLDLFEHWRSNRRRKGSLKLRGVGGSFAIPLVKKTR